MVTQERAVGGLALSTVLLAVGYVGPFITFPAPDWAVWATAMGTAGSFMSLIALGSARYGESRPVPWTLGLLALVLFGGFAAMILLPPPDPAEPVLWLGLPPGAAVLIYVIGLLPLFLAPVAYALDFNRWTLREEDLARVKELAAERRARESDS